jgi:putative heme-binding domain-containing protein
MRPAVGSEFLLSRHFPDDVQGQFTYSCVINMNGMPRFAIYDDSAGYAGHRLKRSAENDQGRPRQVPDDLLASTDKNFRPVDAQIGPDGALWFGDWCNALIGHMQYSQRDPNRDHQHGRVYRLVYKERPLLEPVTQHGKSEAELLEQLRAYEPRIRYRARRELNDRPKPTVVAAVKRWVSQLEADDPEYDRLRCEALWVLQGHHAVDAELLAGVLDSKTPDARAAATHIVTEEREYLPAAFEMLRGRMQDEHPRVRLEAVRGLSFFPTMESVEAALAALNAPMDSWLEYTLEHTIGALEPAWSEAFATGKLAADNSSAQDFVASYVARRQPGLAAQQHIKALLNPETGDWRRDHSYAAMEKLDGNRRNGRAVFRRVCATCHRVRESGYEFGPDLTDVGKRLTRRELIESIVEPSKKLDAKYITSMVITADGKALVGFVKEKTDDSLTLLMQEGKQETLAMDDIDEVTEMKQSSMPENLGSTISSTEFLDLIEYLSRLQ